MKKSKATATKPVKKRNLPVLAKAHSSLGASKAERWWHCPGSVRMEQAIPGSGSSPAAREGTAAHELAERCLNSGRDAIEWLDEVIIVTEKDDKGKDVRYEIEATEDMCEGVQVFVDHVRKVARGGQLMVEQNFDLSPLNPPDVMFGTSDAVVWNARKRILDVVDLKYGYKLVDPEENKQLMYYGLGSVVALGKKPDLIRLWIVQPRAPHSKGPVRCFEMTYKELVAFKRELFEKAQATQEKNAPLSVGPWCYFCKAQAVCPAQHAHHLAIAQNEFDIAEPNPQFPAPEVLNDEQVALILTNADALKSWIGAVQHLVFERLNRGEGFPGYKLVAKRATRKWKNPDDALKALKRHLGDDAYTKKPLSPAQAEAALKKLGKKLNEDLFTKQSSGAKLAPESDPTPALAASAADEFTCD